MRGRAEEMQDAVNYALIHEFINNILCEPIGGFDKEKIIGLIKIIFVFEETNLKSIFCGRIDVAIDKIAECQSAQRNDK